MSRARKLKIEEMERLQPQEYQEIAKRPITVVLDNVRSMHNVGAVFRTADALRLEKIMLCGISGQPPHAEIHKSALGAEEVVPWSYYQNCDEAILQLKANGYQVWALEQAEGSVMLPKLSALLNTHQPLAIVLGNEVEGVQQSVMDLCDGTVEIKQYGTKHSMNVSVAAGIVLWVVSELYKID
ncbi:RNA methyltransferase [Porphyromonadaceae bacterium W3.11]|nr:RNA methyltransferase [Porphyromonadaceae bacterium W3.11]